MMEEIIQQWINEKDLAVLLRTIQELCCRRYEHDIALVYEEYPAVRDFLSEEPPGKRRARDIAFAFMSVNLFYIADGFEKRLSMAGFSDAERDTAYRREKIAELEKSLEQAKKMVR